LAALRQLASVLGAEFHEVESADLVGAIAQFARAHQITYILMGAPKLGKGLARLRLPLPLKLLQALPGVDVRMVADRSQRLAEQQIIAPTLERL